MPGRHQFDYGPSDFDHTQRLVASYVWQLPKLDKANLWLRYGLGDWQTTGIFTYQSGDPLTILAGNAASQTGNNSERAVYLGGNAYGVGGCGNVAPCVNYLNSSAFGLPAIGGFGNIGKGALWGPNLVNWDMGFFKFIPIHENVRLQLRVEFFNTFNRANFLDPTTTVTAGGFGSIRSANDPRIAQLAMKVVF